MNSKVHILKVWGDFACFTRPEMKVERFSYPIITPSAARGIFDAIYCKSKEFRWQITQIELLKHPSYTQVELLKPPSYTQVELLKPPSYIALRRNEVKDKVSEKNIKKWMKGGTEIEPIWADGDKKNNGFGGDEKGRTQRQTMALKNPAYLIHAKIIPRQGFENRMTALNEQFKRRASKGKCIYQPYMGCREFPAYFEYLENGEQNHDTLPVDMDNLGWMLYDVFDLDRFYEKENWEKENHNLSISLFKPVVKNGVMRVPEYSSTEVYKGVRRER